MGSPLEDFYDVDLMNNLGAFCLTSAISVAWSEVCNLLARKSVVSPTTSRKMIHIGEKPKRCLEESIAARCIRFAVQTEPLALMQEVVSSACCCGAHLMTRGKEGSCVAASPC